jgi:hypothetical protein
MSRSYTSSPPKNASMACSGTAYLTLPYLKAVFSIRSLRTRYDVVTWDPLDMMNSGYLQMVPKINKTVPGKNS